MTALETIIRDIIAAQGGLSLAAFMETALQHPDKGYYRHANPIGQTGDFITAPEISQMFGEMLGVWCAQIWQAMGKPDRFALIEYGAGRGTMMRDILRATSRLDGFHAAKQLYLVESNAALRRFQADILRDAAPRFMTLADDLPPLPALMVANEFFDALPVRQFEKTPRGWAERMVVAAGDRLALAPRLLDAAEINLIPPDMRDAETAMIFEFCPQAQTIMRDLARHVATHGGAVLIIDYGYAAPSGKATLQAVAHHAYAKIFDAVGETDLTAHVDFAALAAAADAAGAQTSPVIGQGAFLRNLGIEWRAENLKKTATAKQAAAIDAALHRLTAEDEMGALFKVLEVRA